MLRTFWPCVSSLSSLISSPLTSTLSSNFISGQKVEYRCRITVYPFHFCLSVSACFVCYAMNMIPSYHYSVSSMPFDLNYEDHSHQLFKTNHNQASSSLSYSILYNQDQDQGGSYYLETKPLQSDHEEAEKVVASSGSWDHPAVEKDENYKSNIKLSIWKKEDGNGNLQVEDSSAKLMPLKVRIKRSLMVSNQTGSEIAVISEHKHENQKLPLPHIRTDNSSYDSSNHNHNNTVRVCADCNTTKTPLWRGGPTGPKSLCNACGIRQRKARRALAAAAAAASGTTLVAAADQKPHVKGNHKLQNKGKKFKTELKNKFNLGGRGRKKLGSEGLTTISLSKNLAFPQDEKEAAILLMALSHGLLHGFPTDHYLDS